MWHLEIVYVFPYSNPVPLSSLSFQGNLDPCALYAPADDLEARTKAMCARFGTQKWICNLGEGQSRGGGAGGMPNHKLQLFMKCVGIRRG